ncbi:MAG: lipopolysaccharide biosynthesis protein [Solobacterium sp.]|nr:lipopolysaccharide biosynthesis protein [Solobacterium sp.]
MNKKDKVFTNFLWRLLERFGAQGVTFVVSIVLARILDPAVYGVVAMVAVFTTIMQVFVDSGMGTALIQKKDADDLDFSTVFYFNVVICFILYGLMFMAAPLIASFYRMPELTPLVRVSSLILIISGVKNIQQAYVSRHMLFKKFFFATLGGTVGAAVIGIWMALKGYGVWALVAQNLFNMAMDTIILWLTVKWRPKLMFSFERLKSLFAFGWKLLVSSLLDTGYTRLRELIIGKLYTPSDLAFYNKGQNFPYLVTSNINASIDSVLFPALSSEQEDPQRVKAMTRRAISVSSYIMWPMMMGLAACATPFVRLLLTDKWLPCVFFLRMYCFSYAFYPIHTANLNAIKAMGRSDLYLILEILKKLVGLTALVCTMFISVKAMAYSLFFTSVACQIINSWPNRKLLNYGYLEQLKDILPSLGMALVMAACVFFMQYLPLPTVVILVLQIVIGALIYYLESRIFQAESYNYILDTVKKFIRR